MFYQLTNHDHWGQFYHALQRQHPPTFDIIPLRHALSVIDRNDDKAVTDWLIMLFNCLFEHEHTVLVRGHDEPNYYAKTATSPAQIVFAHGYVASALHEISHWCIAGKSRRLLDDFGYWYCPDGRTQEKQIAFEQVEIRPQAIEFLFSRTLDCPFFVSQDNLTGKPNPNSTFAQDVYDTALQFLLAPDTLPVDAKRLLSVLSLCRPHMTKEPYASH